MFKFFVFSLFENYSVYKFLCCLLLGYLGRVFMEEVIMLEILYMVVIAGSKFKVVI